MTRCPISALKLAIVTRQRVSGFSLIEMLITLAIMLIMISVFSSRFSRSRQEGDLANCRKNLQNIYSALSIYATDNNGNYPHVPGAKTSEEPLSLLIPRCTTDTTLFICPGTKDKPLAQGKPFASGKISYAYYMGWGSDAPANAPLLSDRQVNASSKKTGEQLFSEDGKTAGGNHTKYGGNVLFANGEAQKSTRKSAFDLSFPEKIVFLEPKP
jgi:prepilin-type N-terminal cleavage/methylation domain-containing protein